MFVSLPCREVTAKRGSLQKGHQIKVYGAWFRLMDTERIKPIQQLEEEEGEESDEEDGEEDSTEIDGRQIGVGKQQLRRHSIDSSDEEAERRKRQKG